MDIVDVRVTSERNIVDSILDKPLLDGDKIYTLELTEFTASLENETPLPPLKNFKDNLLQHHILLQVRRKTLGSNIMADGTLLTTFYNEDDAKANDEIPVFAGTISNKSDFYPTRILSLQTPGDMQIELQKFFNRIKQVYIDYATTYNNGGIAIHGAQHGGGNVTRQQLDDDSWVRIILQSNLTLQFTFSPLFLKHFFLVTSEFGKTVLGLSSTLIAFKTVGNNLVTGITALSDDGVTIVAGEVAETIIMRCEYPLTRFFDHRVMIEIDAGGMPLPASVDWTTTNKQAVRHSIASFPVTSTYRTELQLDNNAITVGRSNLITNLHLGNIVFRRAENKVSERYIVLTSKFFQNIRLEVKIVRRVWDYINKQYVLTRRPFTMGNNQSWSSKLRFRTISNK